MIRCPNSLNFPSLDSFDACFIQGTVIDTKEALQLAALWHLAYLFLTAHASTRANSISKDAFAMVPVHTVLILTY